MSFALATALWVVLSDELTLNELLLGAFAAAATLTFTLYIRRCVLRKLAFRVRDLAQGWRIPGNITSGIGEITLILGKDILRIAPAKSLYRVCGFDPSVHDPIRAGCTVLAVVYTPPGPTLS